MRMLPIAMVVAMSASDVPTNQQMTADTTNPCPAIAHGGTRSKIRNALPSPKSGESV